MFAFLKCLNDVTYYQLVIFHISHLPLQFIPGEHSRLKAVSVLLENLWGRTQKNRASTHPSNISDDPNLMKPFVGLTPSQFKIFYSFLNDVCPMEKINCWNFGESVDAERSNKGPESEFTVREKLLIFLVQLRRGFTFKTLAALLSSADRKIEQTLMRKIFTTYIQL